MTAKFGIIGLGMISRFHAQAIAATPGAELIAVLSRDLAKATRFADEFHATPYTNLDELLDQVGLDAISICTLARNYEDIVAAIVNKGKPKITGEEARRAVALITAIYESAASGGKRVEVS